MSDAAEPSLRFRFAVNRLDRRADLRDDPAAITGLLDRDDARFLVVAGDRPLITRGEATQPTAFLPRAAAEALEARFDRAVFLGLAPREGSEGAPWFAVRTRLDEESLAALADHEAADLRTLAITGALATDEYGAIAEGRAALYWHATHRFCARCGGESVPASAGWKRLCPSCGAEHFPRTDPVVIMLATFQGKCLLGRQAMWPKGMYSALAGFLEPGETMEEACARELMEEAALTATKVHYHSTQPWPYPNSLMIGLIAEVDSSDARPDQTELEAVRWFTREEARQLIKGGFDGCFAPPPLAIAHQLVKSWAEGED